VKHPVYLRGIEISFSLQMRFSPRRQNRIVRYIVECNISSSGEISTMIGEYKGSYSAWPEDQVFQREDEIWNEVPMLDEVRLVT